MLDGYAAGAGGVGCRFCALSAFHFGFIFFCSDFYFGASSFLRSETLIRVKRVNGIIIGNVSISNTTVVD